MSRKVKPSEGRVIGFEPIKEQFSKYLLADGNQLLLKVVLLKVKKTNKLNPDGTPIYNFSNQVVATVISSDEQVWKGEKK